MVLRSSPISRASKLSFWFLAAFLVILWVAGGASRADVLGQAVVRFFAWTIVLAAAILLPKADWRAVKEPGMILGATALLIALQLVPLPPAIWTALPGRAIFVDAALLAGMDQPWRPLAISPSGTSNALSSLIVPAAVLVLASNLTREQHWRIGMLILSLIVAGAFVGAIQFSGSTFDNPLINTLPGGVAGNFSNRNHFALFLAIGCLLALAWAFRSEAAPWQALAAAILLVLFLLMILATGSRAGIVLGLMGIALAVLMVHRNVMQKFKAFPRWGLVFMALSTFGAIAVVIWLSITLDRAASIERAVALDSGEDPRGQIWSVVVEMIPRYFPAGSGFGTFDNVFRINEPNSLLRSQYYNLAHNDWLQVLLEGGALAAVLLGAMLLWFFRRSMNAWFDKSSPLFYGNSLARLGSAIIILVFAASVPDYPARTPIMMALLALAAVWLSVAKHDNAPSAVTAPPGTPS